MNYNKLYTPNYPSVGYGRRSFIYGLTLWTGDNVDVRDLRNYWVPGQEGLQQRNYEDANHYNNPLLPMSKPMDIIGILFFQWLPEI